MVMILLNLAHVPDEVAKTIDYSQAGWSVLFKKEMEAYKKRFNERTTVNEYIVDKGKQYKLCEWKF